MSATLHSLESVYGSLTAEITAKMAKLGRIHQEGDPDDDEGEGGGMRIEDFSYFLETSFQINTF